MINPITYLRNWRRLKSVEITINKYRTYSMPRMTLPYKPYLKRPMVKVIRLKVDGVTYALMVISQQKGLSYHTSIDYIWTNPHYTKGTEPEIESAYFQAMYDIFMYWHESIVMSKVVRKKMEDTNKKYTILISINITKEQQVERFRRILTLYGFTPNAGLTLKDVEYKAPYREKEVITNVVYSRTI